MPVGAAMKEAVMAVAASPQVDGAAMRSRAAHMCCKSARQREPDSGTWGSAWLAAAYMLRRSERKSERRGAVGHYMKGTRE
jgi:hypothetical protein